MKQKVKKKKQNGEDIVEVQEIHIRREREIENTGKQLRINK